MTSDIVDFAKEMLEKLEEETREKGGNKYYTWTEHLNIWMNTFLPQLQELSEFEKYNSLMVLRLSELQNLITWIMISVWYGKYHQAIRELRYILDSIGQAYYLDIEHPEATISCKLEIIKEIEKQTFGARLIDRLDLNHKQELKNLYSDLSKYAHSSYQELEPLIKEGRGDWRVTFAFDEDQFSRTVELTNKVMDAVYFIMFHRFPKIAKRVKNSKKIMKSMEELGCKLSLSYLRTI